MTDCLQIKKWAESQGPTVKMAEVGLKDRYGVRAIRTFFNLPFLCLERRV